MVSFTYIDLVDTVTATLAHRNKARLLDHNYARKHKLTVFLAGVLEKSP